VRAIRESDEPATRLAGRYGVSETPIRRIRRNEIWVTRRPREATRLPALATLLLAGLRVSALCQLDESQVDLAARRIRIRRVKTDASERAVPMVPTLHETLLAARAERETHGGPAFPRATARASIRTTSGRGRSHLCASARTSCLPSANSP
jgi:integrase